MVAIVLKSELIHHICFSIAVVPSFSKMKVNIERSFHLRYLHLITLFIAYIHIYSWYLL